MKIRPWTPYPIGPEHVATDKMFAGVFGNFEAEEVARAIVRYCQHQDAWSPFTVDDLGKFFGKRGTEGWLEENLRAITSGAITRGIDQLQLAHYIENDAEDSRVYYLNEYFIERCYSASPSKKNV